MYIKKRNKQEENNTKTEISMVKRNYKQSRFKEFIGHKKRNSFDLHTRKHSYFSGKGVMT